MIIQNSSWKSKAHYLHASNIFVPDHPHEIQTILGSCIAVCLYDRIVKSGGMNHYMVPFWNGTGLSSPKYGNIAIEMLLEKMLEKGASTKNMVAKIFGGANQFDYHNKIIMIGERNIDLAQNMLSKYHIPVIASSVGGTQGRKIIFNTYTGQVKMKYIVKIESNAIN